MAAERKIKGVTARARFVDWLGRYLIAIGRIGIIAAVLGIFVFILGEAYPLFQDPELEGKELLPTPGDGGWLAVGGDPYREVAFVVGARGWIFCTWKPGSGYVQSRWRNWERRASSRFIPGKTAGGWPWAPAMAECCWRASTSSSNTKMISAADLRPERGTRREADSNSDRRRKPTAAGGKRHRESR